MSELTDKDKIRLYAYWRKEYSELGDRKEEMRKENEKLKDILLELAPWASAAQDDPNCCEELKDIFLKVIDNAR